MRTVSNPSQWYILYYIWTSFTNDKKNVLNMNATFIVGQNNWWMRPPNRSFKCMLSYSQHGSSSTHFIVCSVSFCAAVKMVLRRQCFKVLQEIGTIMPTVLCAAKWIKYIGALARFLEEIVYWPMSFILQVMHKPEYITQIGKKTGLLVWYWV